MGFILKVFERSKRNLPRVFLMRYSWSTSDLPGHSASPLTSSAKTQPATNTKLIYYIVYGNTFTNITNLWSWSLFLPFNIKNTIVKKGNKITSVRNVNLAQKVLIIYRNIESVCERTVSNNFVEKVYPSEIETSRMQPIMLRIRRRAKKYRESFTRNTRKGTS